MLAGVGSNYAAPTMGRRYEEIKKKLQLGFDGFDFAAKPALNHACQAGREHAYKETDYQAHKLTAYEMPHEAS
jgi:hypothetical protein